MDGRGLATLTYREVKSVLQCSDSTTQYWCDAVNQTSLAHLMAKLTPLVVRTLGWRVQGMVDVTTKHARSLQPAGPCPTAAPVWLRCGNGTQRQWNSGR